MPIYEYQCESCGYEFEKLQKMSDDALVDCPQCQQPKLKKLISAAGFQLKGDGWYVTDFRDKKKTENASTPKKEPAADQKASTSASSDSKASKSSDSSASSSKKAE
ncbi:MAG: zinc ribbon domain-containing protein [Pseudomonadota bacterium]